jgi:hypothetical protein
MIYVLFGEGARLSNRELRHYTARLQYSRRLRYRFARLLVICLPLVLFFYALSLGNQH